MLALLLLVSVMVPTHSAKATFVNSGFKIVQQYDFSADATAPPYVGGLVSLGFPGPDSFGAGDSWQLNLFDSANALVFQMFGLPIWGTFSSIGVGFTFPAATNDTIFTYELVMLTGSMDINFSLFLRTASNSFTSSGKLSENVVPVGGAVIPLPAALPLFGTGLGILGFLGWRRRRKAQAV